MSDKNIAIPASYVILERADGKMLLLRRANTGYMDGRYQMPSGHVEAQELPSAAAVREAREEVGVTIEPEDLILAHISYRTKFDHTADRVDFYFRTTKWSGEPINAEPEKCDELLWADPADLPADTVPVVRYVLGLIAQGVAFSELTPDQYAA